MHLRGMIGILAGLATLSGMLFAMEWVVDAIVGTAGGAAFMRNTPSMVLWLAWEAVSLAVGGFVTGSIARQRPVRHAVAMGAIQAVMTLAAMFSVRGDSPVWFWLLGIASMVPAAWWGGVVAGRLRPRVPLA